MVLVAYSGIFNTSQPSPDFKENAAVALEENALIM